MEFMVKYMSDSLKFSAIGLMGFSTGSMATIIYQMQNPAVKAVVSLDGSQEYAFYSILYKMEAFDLARANTPYLMIANKYKDYSVFPYYSSIPAAHKYLYRTTEMDHNGFISYWSQFARCSKHSLTNSFVESYSVLGDCVIHFFDNTLKAGFEHPIEYAIANHELIQKDSTDYTPVAHFLNQVLEDGIESSLAGLQSNEKKYKGKSNMINVVGRMFLGNENDMAIKIFKANAEMHPDSWECFYHLALAYKESNNKEAAKNAIAKAMDLDKNNDEILKLSADIQKMNGA
jgi:tetratricopeptide (TPR) repeat protein